MCWGAWGRRTRRCASSCGGCATWSRPVFFFLVLFCPLFSLNFPRFFAPDCAAGCSGWSRRAGGALQACFLSGFAFFPNLDNGKLPRGFLPRSRGGCGRREQLGGGALQILFLRCCLFLTVLRGGAEGAAQAGDRVLTASSHAAAAASFFHPPGTAVAGPAQAAPKAFHPSALPCPHPAQRRALCAPPATSRLPLSCLCAGSLALCPICKLCAPFASSVPHLQAHRPICKLCAPFASSAPHLQALRPICKLGAPFASSAPPRPRRRPWSLCSCSGTRSCGVCSYRWPWTTPSWRVGGLVLSWL